MSSSDPPLSPGPRFSPITSTNHAGSLWIASVLCLIYSVLTLVVRGHIKWNLYGLDDWLVAAATATQLGQVVALFVALQHGVGISDDLVAAADRSIARKGTFASQTFFILSLCLAKCSVLALMMRLFSLNTGGSGAARVYSKTWVGCNAVLVGVVIWGIASVIGLSVACSADGFIDDLHGTVCRDQLLRWRLIAAFDVVTEVVLVSLPALIVWPVQMSYQRKSQVFMAFAFRLPLAAFAVIHLHYVGDYVHATDTSLAIVPALAWQQIELCWSLISASIPNLKSFMKSFSTGLGMEGDLTSRGYDLHYNKSGSQHGHPLQSLRSRATAKGPSPSTTTHHATENFRPDFGEYSATVERGHVNKDPRDASSFTSGGSQDMIIQKDVQYNVQYEAQG